MVAAAALLAPAEASAKPGLTTGLFALEYRSPDDALRGLAFDQTVEANAGLVRVDAVWRSVVGAQRPANPGNPSDPAYDFSAIDRAVRGAGARGLPVELTAYSAPDWAEGPGRPTSADPGVWKPDAEEYGRFASALAKRYSGSFPDPAGTGALPRVRYFEPWNEPNLESFLAPQWEGKTPTGVNLYRGLLDSFASSVKAIHGDNRVIGPATAPFGDPPGGRRTRPVRFLRDLLCLKGRKKPKPTKCPERATLDIVSHHPISLRTGVGDIQGPKYSGINPDDAPSGGLDKITRVVRAAEKAGTVRPGGNLPLWVTEFWWFSNPPSEDLGVPLDKHAQWIEEALYVYWKAGARVAVQFLLRDEAFYTTGLLFSDGAEKPAYRAFSFPFVGDRRSRKKVLAWGKAPVDGKLRIQVRKGGRWRTAERLKARAGKVFTTRIKLRGKAQLRASVAGEQSLVWEQKG